MTYSELKKRFREQERSGSGEHLTAILLFTEDSFAEKTSILSRAYLISSNNKAFRPRMLGYSIYGSCLDGTDAGVRLDLYMAEEKGGDAGWKVQDAYILEHMRGAAQIPSCTETDQGDGTVAFFIGEITIRARKQLEGTTIRLEAVCGDQVSCGEWVDLDDDQVVAYCILLERFLNQKG